MDVQQMHIDVEQGLQKMGSFVYDNFLPEEIDGFLNKMQERLIKDRVFPSSDPKQIGFSGNMKRLQDVQNLIKSSTLTTGIDDSFHTEYVLPSDLLYIVNPVASSNLLGCTNTVASSVRIVEIQELYAELKNPFATSQIESPIGVVSGDHLSVYKNIKKFILKGVTLNYIRVPRKISLSLTQDCELPQHTHSEIVDMTIKHILEVIESPRFQSNSIEESQSE